MSSSPLGTRTLKLKIGTQEYTADVNNCTIDVADSDSDWTSFADAAAGGAKAFTLKFTATQDPADATSIWNKIWTSAGSTIGCMVAPYGVSALSATAPGVSGSVVVDWPDGTILGGDADASTTAKFTMDLEWPFTAKPSLITTGTF